MADAHMAYCVKDRKMVEMKDAHVITMKNGRNAMQGVCPTCGTKVTRIMGGSSASSSASSSEGSGDGKGKGKSNK